MKTILSLFFIFLFCLTSFAQKTKTATGEALLRQESNMTIDDVKREAMERAKIDAIEKTFGSAIIQGNRTLIKNQTTGKKVETKMVFNTIADSYVNGEWLKTLSGPDYEVINRAGEIWYKCTIKGKIRELVAPKISFKVYTLDCPELKCKTEEFLEDENLYLYFKSPVNGYINIFLDDGKDTYRLLPYKNSSRVNHFPVKADKEYIFFSASHDYLNEKHNIDEQVLYAESQSDLNKIYVIFSAQYFTKPLLEDKTHELLSPEDIAAGYSLPKSISSEGFQYWLQKLKSKDKVVESDYIYISIDKP